MTSSAWRACTTPGCPQLVNQANPCPHHGRPVNASWSPQRDKRAHWRLRMAVIKARGPKCERCTFVSPDGRGRGLQLHHVRPGDRVENVVLLCRACHRAVDHFAR